MMLYEMWRQRFVGYSVHSGSVRHGEEQDYAKVNERRQRDEREEEACYFLSRRVLG